MSIGSSTCVTILVGNGRLGGISTLKPKGNPNVTGRISMRALSSRNSFASLLPRVRNSWLSWPPMETDGTIGTPAAMAVRT